MTLLFDGLVRLFNWLWYVAFRPWTWTRATPAEVEYLPPRLTASDVLRCRLLAEREACIYLRDEVQVPDGYYTRRAVLADPPPVARIWNSQTPDLLYEDVEQIQRRYEACREPRYRLDVVWRLAPEFETTRRPRVQATLPRPEEGYVPGGVLPGGYVPPPGKPCPDDFLTRRLEGLADRAEAAAVRASRSADYALRGRLA